MLLHFTLDLNLYRVWTTLFEVMCCISYFLVTGGHVSFSDMFVTLMIAIVSAQALGRAAMFTISLHKGRVGAFKVIHTYTTFYPT